MSVAGAAVSTPAFATAEDAKPVRLDRLQLFIIFVCGVGVAVDLAELAYSSILSAVFLTPPHALDQQQLAFLLSSVYVGAAIGAPISGWLADRYGRRTLMMVAMAILAGGSLAAGLAHDPTALIASRGISGLAIGAYPPLMYTFLSEVLPASRRGAVLMFLVAGASLAPPALIAVAGWLTPIAPLGYDGWRWGFFIGAAFAAATAALLRAAPESPRWLAHRQHVVGKGTAMAAGPGIAAGGAALRQGPADTAATPGKNEFAAKLPLLIAVNMLGPWSAAGFSMLLGAVLVLKGFALADALFYVALLKMGQTFGAIAGGILVDRFERRTTLIFAAGSMAVVGAAFGMSGEPAVLILIGALYTAISAVYVPLVGLYGAEIFSTARRARATTLASAANRVSAIVVPLVLLPVLQSVGPQLLYVLTGFILVAIVSLLVLFGPITGDRRNAD